MPITFPSCLSGSEHRRPPGVGGSPRALGGRLAGTQDKRRQWEIDVFRGREELGMSVFRRPSAPKSGKSKGTFASHQTMHFLLRNQSLFFSERLLETVMGGNVPLLMESQEGEAKGRTWQGIDKSLVTQTEEETCPHGQLYPVAGSAAQGPLSGARASDSNVVCLALGPQTRVPAAPCGAVGSHAPSSCVKEEPRRAAHPPGQGEWTAAGQTG